MKPNENKRKVDQTDDDVIPGTPEVKHTKKKQRKKSTKSIDCADLLAGIDFTEEMPIVNDPVIQGKLNREDLEDLLNGIDVFDDFNSDNGEVSLYCSMLLNKHLINKCSITRSMIEETLTYPFGKDVL